jgi:hypothetical protein
MKTEQAIKILEQALNASSKAGVFNLQDSATVAQALQNVIQFVNTNHCKEDQPDVEQEVETKK